MRITTKITWNMITGEVLEHQWYEYNGEVALCVRSIEQGAAKNAKEAGATAAGYGSSAAADSAAVTPFLNQELKAKHGFDPNQINEMLTAAGAGTGAAQGAIEGQANLEAARTRNASGFTKTLDEAARQRMKTAAGTSEGVAAEDVMGAKQLNQAGAEGLTGLYGTNVGAQLKAMGQQNEDLNTQLNAGKSGWAQNAMAAANTAANVMSSVCPAKGSMYRMADGDRLPVDLLVVGDRIVGIDGEAQTILEIQVFEVPLLKVELADGRVLRNSYSHEFILPFGGFTVASHSIGKTIKTEDGASKVVSIRPDGVGFVYNVITDGSHTYSADGVWALGVGESKQKVSNYEMEAVNI
jgi:hypothetical protein